MIQRRTKLYNIMFRELCNATERTKTDEDQENEESGSDFVGTVKNEAINDDINGSEETTICTRDEFVCKPENLLESNDAIASTERNTSSSLKAIPKHKDGVLKAPKTELQMSGIMVMAGYLKKRLSLVKGYRDQWIVLADDGYLKHFNEKPIHEHQKPRGEIFLLLSDTFVNKDGLSFTVISASSNVFRLRADHIEKRNEWIQAINYARSKLYNRIFKGFHDLDESRGTYTDLYQKNDSKEKDHVFQPENESDVDDVIAVAEANIVSLFQTQGKRSCVAVAAIELGNTKSGCAFSTAHEFKTSPLNIYTFQLDHYNVSSYKTPTVLLLTPDGRFHSFGTTAENHYETLTRKEEANSWYYFNRFKMKLCKKDLTSDMAIKEVGGKTMKAMVVFAYCIEHIKDKVLNRLKQAINGLDENDVHWVVTVPATWNEQARQVMIEASAKAGINKDSLTLALEPECTAMYCIYLAMNKQEHGDNMETKAFNENSGLIVVDLGSRTINISEVLSTGQLREIYNATGGPLVGNYINDQIIKILKNVIGWEEMRKIKTEDYDDYLEILRQVERVKRAVDHDSEFSVRIPKEILTNIYVPDSLKQYVRVGRKCITLSASLIQKILSSSVDSMIKHVDELLKKEDACSVSTILLVGGYSASNVIQHAFREKFEKKYRVIIPLTPDLLVLKGAVITGHCVEDIGGRMAKYHYGLGLSTAAVSGRVISIGDNEKKTYFMLIKKCNKIKVGEVVTQYEIVLKAKSRWDNLEMYTNKDDNPGIIIDNEHLKKVGSILVKLPQYKKESILILTISYDETECKVSATDKNTGRCFDAICKFLKKETD